jgi:transposase
METWETLTMSRKEVPRAGLLKLVLDGTATNAQGAASLGLSARHIQRLKARWRTEGPAGLRHRTRGRPSPRRLPKTVTAQIDALLQTRYKDFNDCHATEKLREVEGLRVSRELVRRRRRALGLPAKHRRRARVHRHRRTPEARMGQLVQVDASPFAWLGVRGPAMTLHGAIDDATNTVLALHFRPTEDLHGYAVVFQQLFTQYGVPLAFYGDRINILVRNDPHWTLDEQLRGAQDPTHLGRILHDLGIGYIAAGSPEAKGRVERLWRTLQDRLTSELRLRQIATPEAANAFLPEFLRDFNARFTRTPAEAAPAWRRAPRDLALVLSCRYTRRVARDNTVHLGPRWIQLPPGPYQRSYAGCRVELRELLDGRLVVLHDGAVRATQPAPPDFTFKPHSAPSSNRRHPAQRPGPPPEALSCERAAPHTAQDQRGDLKTTSTPPPKPRSARPATRHPWRRAITKKAQALYPVLG